MGVVQHSWLNLLTGSNTVQLYIKKIPQIVKDALLLQIHYLPLHYLQIILDSLEAKYSLFKLAVNSLPPKLKRNHIRKGRTHSVLF